MLILGLLYAVPAVFMAFCMLGVIQIANRRLTWKDAGTAMMYGLLWPLVVIKML